MHPAIEIFTLDFKVYLHARSNIVLELPLMVDSLVTYKPCESMSILMQQQQRNLKQQ